MYEVLVCLISWQCTEIQRVQHVEVYNDRVRKPAVYLYGYGHIRIPVFTCVLGKGSRAYRKVIAQQSEPQRVDLNVHNNISTIYHTKYSFTTQVCVASITWLLASANYIIA